jgi:hypothetical protein
MNLCLPDIHNPLRVLIEALLIAKELYHSVHALIIGLRGQRYKLSAVTPNKK